MYYMYLVADTFKRIKILIYLYFFSANIHIIYTLSRDFLARVKFTCTVQYKPLHSHGTNLAD